MNRETVLASLKGIIGAFCATEAFLRELLDLIAEKGIEASFFSLLVARLRLLAVEGVKAVRHKEFELIGNGIYSMHLARKGYNIRILYGFLPNGEPALLLAFYERGGKRKTDYTPYLRPAAERLQVKIEEFEQ